MTKAQFLTLRTFIILFGILASDDNSTEPLWKFIITIVVVSFMWDLMYWVYKKIYGEKTDA